MKLDFYLGSDLGDWALTQIDPATVGTIITFDQKTADHACDMGLPVLFGNGNKKEIDVAPIGFSVHYPRIIQRPLLKRYQKAYNLHPGYLPWGRGYYPIFWAMWEDSPAGATLHEMVEEVDAGAIVTQIEVEKFAHDTGYTLFQRVREAEKEIFNRFYSNLIDGGTVATQQPIEKGTYHTKAEFFAMKRMENWAELEPQALVKLIRCLSFPKYSGLEIDLGEHKFSLTAEDIGLYE